MFTLKTRIKLLFKSDKFFLNEYVKLCWNAYVINKQTWTKENYINSVWFVERYNNNTLDELSIKQIKETVKRVTFK